MCNSSRITRLMYSSITHNLAFLVLALSTSYILCWLFTFLDPNIVPKFITGDATYKNSDALIKSLEAKLQTSEDSEDFTVVKNDEDLLLRNEGYTKYGFNALASRNIGIYRDIPDTRHKLCDSISYPSNLPTASVVICFYNEDYPTLQRTLHTVIQNTPISILKEIILVDDYSDIDDLYEIISNYIDTTNELKNIVQLFKTSKREGLIRARLFGADKSSGDVLVFLDSHVEVNKKWLEPLLTRIYENETRVVTPIIDIINPDTFQYKSSPLVRGGFNWGLHFKWESIPKSMLENDDDFIKPVSSPTMAGGLFAMNRKYFYQLGSYDSHMEIWGGENLELSFKVWMCGGTLEIIPCSRVGHVFRKHRPYAASNGEDTMIRNSLRVAHVWLDQYKKHYFTSVPEAKTVEYGDISERIELRKKLKCNDFEWYLKNVYPELIIPGEDQNKIDDKLNLYEKPVYERWDQRSRTYVDRFMIRLSGTNLCITSKKDIRDKGSFLILRSCIRSKQQMWYQTDKNELILSQILCLDSGTGRDKPKLSKCHEMGGTQEWKFSNSKNTPIYNIAAGTCLAVESPKIDQYVVLSMCNNSDNTQWYVVTTNKQP